MAACSAMLVGPTVLLGVVLAVAARAPSPVWPVLVCLPSLALTAASLVRTARRWDDPVTRSAVVQAVSRG